MRIVNVLIIDDDANIRKLLSELLTGKPGYKVLVAGDGKEAVRCFVEQRIDVVLTDIHMPGNTGFEVMADMQKVKFKPEILVMTANATPENVETARKIGARSVILKPFDNLDVVEAEIQKAVKAVLDAGGGTDSGAAAAPPTKAAAAPAKAATPADLVSGAKPAPPVSKPVIPPGPKPFRIPPPPAQPAAAARIPSPPQHPPAAERPAVKPAPEPDSWSGALVGNETPDTPAPAGSQGSTPPPQAVATARPDPASATIRIAPPRPAAARPAAAPPKPPAPVDEGAGVESVKVAPAPERAAPATGGATEQGEPSHQPEMPPDLSDILQMVGSLDASSLQMQVPIICLQTWEEKAAVATLRQAAASMSREFFTWSAARGLVKADGQTVGEMYRDPARALEFVRRQKNKGLYLLADFRQCLEDRTVVRMLREMVMEGETSRALLVLTAPRLPIPPELQSSCASFDWPAGGDDVEALYDEVVAEVAASSGRAIRQDRAARAALLMRVKEMPAGRARFEIARALMSLAKRAS